MIIEVKGFQGPLRFGFGTQKEPKSPGWESWIDRRPSWKQVHGVAVTRVEWVGQECGEVDALWTSSAGIPVSVVTADCIPLLMSNRHQAAVAALHCGWRGIYSGIVGAFFSSLPEPWSDPGDWEAILGPSIRPCCYEVGSDLIRDFAVRFPEISSRDLEPKPRHLDLIPPLSSSLEKHGVKVLKADPECTCCTREGESFKYHSYRRGDRNARQFSVIQIESSS